MSTVNRILSAILILILMLCISSCSSEQTKPSMNYERPITTMARAIDTMDNDAYLNCFTRGAKQAYIAGKEYNKELVKTLLPSNEASRIIKAKVVSYDELGENEINEIKKQYKEKYKMRIDILKARKLTVEVGTISEGNEKIDKRSMTVVLADNRWQIFGDVIEKFDFK